MEIVKSKLKEGHYIIKELNCPDIYELIQLKTLIEEVLEAESQSLIASNFVPCEL